MPESRWRTTPAASEANPLWHVSEMLIVLDAGERIVGWNRAAEEHFQSGEGEASGERLQMVYNLCWASPEERHAAIAEVVDRGVWRGRRVRVIAGERIDIECTISALLDANGTSVGRVITVRDGTRQHRLEAGRSDWSPRMPRQSRPAEAGRGVISICASCKAMRDIGSGWQQAEVYVGRRFDASFTHGMCPECLQKFYPGLGQAGLTSP